VTCALEEQIDLPLFDRSTVPDHWAVRTTRADRVFLVDRATGQPVPRRDVLKLVQPWVEELDGIKLTTVRAVPSVTRLELAGLPSILHYALARKEAKDSGKPPSSRPVPYRRPHPLPPPSSCRPDPRGGRAPRLAAPSRGPPAARAAFSPAPDRRPDIPPAPSRRAGVPPAPTRLPRV